MTRFIISFRVALFAIGVYAALWPVLAQAERRPFSVADDVQLAHFGDPYGGEVQSFEFSPDGRHVVVVTERGVIESNRPESTLRVYAVDALRRFVNSREAVPEPRPEWIFSKSTYKNGPIVTGIRWLDDSSGFAFLMKAENGTNQLVLADLGRRVVEELTPAGAHVTAFSVRDREHLVYCVQSPEIAGLAASETEASYYVGTERSLYSLIDPEWHFRHAGDRSDLWAVVDGRRFQVRDADSGDPLRVFLWGQQTLALSPDGATAVVAMPRSEVPLDWPAIYPPPQQLSSYRIIPGKQDLHAINGTGHLNEFVTIELSSGRVRQLTQAPLGSGVGWRSAAPAADWSADGKSVVLVNTFVARELGNGTPIPQRPGVVVIGIPDGSIQWLESMIGPTASGRYLRQVRFAAGSSERIEVGYVTYGSETRGRSAYTLGRSGWSESPPAPRASGAPLRLEVKEGLNDPPVLIAFDPDTGASRVVLDPNPQLAQLDLGHAEVFRWRDESGHEWTGGLYKPSNFVAGKRYPLVLQTHGFSDKVFRPEGKYPAGMAARALAMLGFVVLQAPDGPFTEDEEEGPRMLRSYEAAVRKLVDAGLVDSERLGITGFSRTCYYVLLTLTDSKLKFRAASITDGVNAGYLQFLAGVDQKMNAGARFERAINGAMPYAEGLLKWFDRSPGFKMHKVTAALQVVGLSRGSMLSMWEPYAMLRHLKRPTDLIIINDATHVPSNPAHRLASQGMMIDWMRFWLNDERDAAADKRAQYVRWEGLRNPAL